MKKVLFLPLFLFLLSVTFISAEFTIEQCVESALSHSYEVQISRLSYANSKDAMKVTAWNFLPNLSFRSSIGRLNGEFTYTENIVQVSGSYDLFDSRYFGYQLANSNLLQSKLNLQEVKNNVEIKVYEYYAQLLLIKEKLAVIEETLEVYRQAKSLNAELLKIGSVNRLDILSLEYEIQRLETSLTELRASYKFYLNRLNHLTNLQLTTSDTISPLPTYKEAQNSSKEPDYSKNISWQMQEQEVVKAQIMNRYNLFKSFPNLSFQYYYDYSKGSNLTEGVQYVHEDWNNEWAIYLSLSLSLNNLKSFLFERPTAKRNKQIEELNFQNMSSFLKLDIRDKENRIAVLQAELQSANTILSIAESRSNLAFEQYSKGLINFTELNNYRIDWLEATIKLYELDLSLLVEQKKLQKLLGNS